MAQKHTLRATEIALLAAGAAIAVFLARPAEAFAIRFSTVETSVTLGMAAAIALFVLRKYRKDLYGALEVVMAFFALAIAGDRVTADDVAASAIGFLGSVYILVRGMTNFLEGRKERSAS